MELKKFRKLKGHSQTDLANLLEVSLKTAQNYERGNVTVPNEKLKLIAEIYNVTIPEIFGGDRITLNIENININEVSQFVYDNWDTLMSDRLFKAKFESEASQWALSKVNKAGA